MKPGVEIVKLSVTRGKIGPMSKHIPDEAVEAAVEVLWDKEVTAHDVRAALDAAAPHMLAEAWESAYRTGVDDERISQSNAGIAGCFCSSFPCRCFIEPARANPYRTAK